MQWKIRNQPIVVVSIAVAVAADVAFHGHRFALSLLQGRHRHGGQVVIVSRKS